jgi:hypothetical protein
MIALGVTTRHVEQARLPRRCTLTGKILQLDADIRQQDMHYSPCAKLCDSACFLQRHRAAYFLSKGTVFSKLGMAPKRFPMYRISMDTVPFLETIVYFHSYTHYKVLHWAGTQSRKQGRGAHKTSLMFAPWTLATNQATNADGQGGVELRRPL